MKLPYQLLALDVDGTLLDSHNQLPEANRAALHRAHQAGLKICLCTGRSLTETRSVLKAIGLDLDAGIFAFGSVISALPAGRTLVRTPLPLELADRLIHFLQARGFPALVLYDADEAGLDYTLVHGRRNLEAYETWVRITPTRTERAEVWQPKDHPPIRIGIIESPAHIAATLAALRAAFPPEVMKCNAIYAPNYRLHVVECFAPQVNKWYGISQLCRLWGIPGSCVVTVGDDTNDVEMIARAGLGVAMGNAIEPVRAAARLHVASHDACGVADLVDRLLAGEVPSPLIETA